MKEENKFDQKVRAKLSEREPDVPPELETLVRNRLRVAGLLPNMRLNWIFIMNSVLIFFVAGTIIYKSYHSETKMEVNQPANGEISNGIIFNSGDHSTITHHSDAIAMNTTESSRTGQLPSASFVSHQNKQEDIIHNGRQMRDNSHANQQHVNEIPSLSGEPFEREVKQTEKLSKTSGRTSHQDNRMQSNSTDPVYASAKSKYQSSPESISENRATTNSASSIGVPDKSRKTSPGTDASGDEPVSRTYDSERMVTDQNPPPMASTSGAIPATEIKNVSTEYQSAEPVDVSMAPEAADLNSETGIGLPGEFKQSLEAFGGFQWTAVQKNSGAGGWNSEENSNHSKFNGGIKWNLYRGKFSLATGINYSTHSNRISTAYDTTMMGQSFSFPAHVNTEFNTIDVPILVGYLTNINRIMIHIETGMSISFINGSESSLTIDSTGAEIKKFDQFGTESSFNNFILQVSVLYPVGDHFSIFVQPTMNYGRTTIYRDLDQMINMYSIRTGVRWFFQL